VNPDEIAIDWSSVPDPRDAVKSATEDAEVRVFLISGPLRSGKTVLSEMLAADVAFDHTSIAVTCGQVYHAALTARRSMTIVVEAVDPYDIALYLRDLCENLDGVSFRHISITA
jgi:hypothetical protein